GKAIMKMLKKTINSLFCIRILSFMLLSNSFSNEYYTDDEFIFKKHKILLLMDGKMHNSE
ncbi:MAG: hypothetical protein WCR36_06720, partial [Bacteroidaceae bacterium]